MSAFFTLHQDLPREGPGEPEDIAWAVAQMSIKPKARICDVACGPGADIATWRAHVPDAHITAVERHPGFVKEARQRVGSDPKVTIVQGDMADLSGPYDVIWCAGAAYFLGVENALELWRSALAPDGYIVFSDACWFTSSPSALAKACWEEYPSMTDAAGIAAHVTAAGYETLATRRLSSAAWAAYYDPMEARIAMLRPGADAALSAVLKEGEQEIAAFRQNGSEYSYLLSVVRPL